MEISKYHLFVILIDFTSLGSIYYSFYTMIPEQPDALPDTTPSILILGGTNFMGKALLSRLSSLPYRLCCINRGKVYWYLCWDSGTIRPEITRVSSGSALIDEIIRIIALLSSLPRNIWGYHKAINGQQLSIFADSSGATCSPLSQLWKTSHKNTFSSHPIPSTTTAYTPQKF